MTDELNRPARVQRVTILVLTLLVSVVFLVVIRNFLMALFFAAVFAALAYPLYSKVLPRLGGRNGLAAAVTILVLVLIVLLPALGMLDLIAVQAYGLAQKTVPWLEQELKNPEGLSITIPDWVPYRTKIEASGPQIVNKLGELVTKAGGYLVSGL